MLSSVWLRSLRARPRRVRLDSNRERSGFHHRIDIELGHSFDPHLVTKIGVGHDRCRVIGNRRLISVIGIGLFPNRAILESDLGATLEAFNGSIDATSQ